jgi:hypothetical protein
MKVVVGAMPILPKKPSSARLYMREIHPIH